MKKSLEYWAVLNRMGWLGVWLIFVIPQFASFSGKWNAFNSDVNKEVSCTNMICKENTEWKEVQIYRKSTAGDGPIPLLRSLQDPKVCISISGTGATKVEATIVELLFEGKLGLKGIDAEYKSNRTNNCVPVPQDDFYGFRITKILYQSGSQLEIDKLLKEASDNGLNGLNDDILKEYSFKLKGEYRLEFFQLLFLYFITIIAGYLAIELALKTFHWVRTGENK